MDLQKIRVRQDLERMVINYFLRGDISETQSADICNYIDSAIGGGNFPKPDQRRAAVITFPGTYTGRGEAPEETPEETAETEAGEETPEIYAPYGEPLPDGVKDFRRALQRDGLALILWEKLTSKEGLFYDILWAKATGPRRLTEWSGAVREEDIPYVMPLDIGYSRHDHERMTPRYTVRVAPENVLEGTVSDFSAYVQSLKAAGIRNGAGEKINFDYVFNFAAEKRERYLQRNRELTALKLSARVIGALNDRQIYNVKELKKITVQELRAIRKISGQTITETLALLKQAGITLREAQENYA
jgi:hypothetical protein